MALTQLLRSVMRLLDSFWEAFMENHRFFFVLFSSTQERICSLREKMKNRDSLGINTGK